LALPGLLLAACAVQPKLPPPSTDIDETVFRRHLGVLASDEFEGRKPGTAGEEKTVAYLVEQFRKLGLKPGLKSGGVETFLQPVPMVESVAGADASVSIEGSRAPLTLAYGKDVVIWSGRGLAEAELKHSDLIFVGYGIVAPDHAWNDYAGVDVHGKTVVVLINDPGFATKDPKVFKGGTMTYYGRWDYKIEEAARQGAAGVLLIHDAAAAGFGWQVVQNTWMGAQLSLASADPSADHAILEGWLQGDAARALFGAAGLDFAAEAAAAAHAGFKARSMGVQADATLHSSVRQITSNNVIAVLPGGSRHREYVVYTAHWDHLGRDPGRAGHNIFNGAVDDASGVAGLLAMAQSFIRTKPVVDRSIVFLALTGTESGRLGSRFYVEHPAVPLRDTAAAINLDGLRNGGPTRDVTLFGYGNTDLEQYARAAALLQGRDVTPEPQPEQGLYFRSDNFSFADAGVPALYEQRGTDDTARGPAWGRAQLDDYMQHRYRQAGDQYSPDWDVRGALDDLRLDYEVGLRVARSRRFPRWYPNSEFRLGHDYKPAP
jgi:Zn-dependent M28 family amino/carboxypeptidase